MIRHNGIKALATVLLLFLGIAQSWAQCEVTATVIPDNIVCGDCATLTAFGQGQGQQIFNEDFNSGSPTGWAFTQQATFNNPCSAAGVDGTPHIWMGDQSGVPRVLETIDYNISTATAGVTVCFDMLFAEQGNNAPCEGPDEPDEGVTLQYSIDGGATWVDIFYFDPNGGNDPNLVNWNNWCFQLPAAAITSATRIRWFQDNDSGADYDHWGIDNVEIYFNDPTYVITWAHDNFSYPQGNSGGPNPTPVCPRADEDYIVTMTNGTSTCRDTISVTVDNPTIVLDAGNDTTICSGDCLVLNATAKVVKRPAKTPTYENNEITPVVTGLGQNTEININITDLNMTNVLPGSITEVCINSLNFFGINLFPPGQQTIGDLEVRLICPDGTTILLVPSGVTTSTSPLDGYINTCFTPVATNTLAASSPSYTGSFVPNEPLDDLAGCTANGLWTMQFQTTTALGFGTGFFGGWSISFDDPEISYTADLSWDAPTNLNDPLIVNPTACPPVTETFTITASDTAGCVTVSDDITVTVDANCCLTAIDSVVTVDPNCGQSNGSIVVVPTQVTATGIFSIDGGLTFQPGPTFNNLPAGNYEVILAHPTCNDTTTVTLVNPGAPTITNVATTDPNCGASDGSITITATGATQYSIDNGVTFQAGSVFNGLPAGTYDIVVEDGSGCQAVQSVTLTDLGGPSIGSVTTVDPTCGNSDGSIEIFCLTCVQFSIDGGVTSQVSDIFPGLPQGTYNIVVEDANGCTADTVINLSDQGGTTITNVAVVDPTCGVDNGSITITAAGATQYSIDNGVTFQAGSAFTGLAPGTYNIVVEDASGCSASASETLTDSGLDSIIATTVDPTCVSPNGGSITITPFGTPVAIQYSIDGGLTFQASNMFTGLSSNTYTVVALDGNGCTDTILMVLSTLPGPVIDSIQVTDATCGNADGSIVVFSPGATQYSNDNGATFQASGTFSGLAQGTYTIMVRNPQGCPTLDTVTINNQNGPAIDSITTVDPNCGSSDGVISIFASGGAAPLEYSFTGGGSPFVLTNVLSNLPSGSYDIIVQDATGCRAFATVVLTEQGGPTIDLVTPTQPNCGVDDGALDITATGATQYSIDGGANFQPSGSFTGLGTGTYNIVVEDANGCQDNATEVLANAAAPTIDNIASTDPACGASDGTITITATGATQYSIDNGVTFEPSGSFTGLSVGIYDIVVEDASGCQTIDQVPLSNIGGPTINDVTPSDPTCDFENGQLVVDASGGTGILGYSADSGATFQLSSTFNGLSAGSYNVIVQDENACQAIWPVITLSAGDNPTVTYTLEEDTCNFDAGRIILEVTGGAPPYTYRWSHDNTLVDSVAEGLNEGVFNIRVTDANRCIDTAIATLTCIEFEPTWYIPNAFSPNGDGINDIFELYGFGIAGYDMKVYDRWGEKVYDSKGATIGWDGTNKSKALPPDVFIYQVFITFKNDELLKVNGSVTLMR